eukprot:14054889-Alexandrium_andersonii.AAC.1
MSCGSGGGDSPITSTGDSRAAAAGRFFSFLAGLLCAVDRGSSLGHGCHLPRDASRADGKTPPPGKAAALEIEISISELSNSRAAPPL